MYRGKKIIHKIEKEHLILHIILNPVFSVAYIECTKYSFRL